MGNNLDSTKVNNLFNISKAADHLGVCRKTVYNWMNKGIIMPSVWYGQRKYFTLEDLSKCQRPVRAK